MRFGELRRFCSLSRKELLDRQSIQCLWSIYNVWALEIHGMNDTVPALNVLVIW